LSAQIQRERYIYYKCSGFKGDCGERYLREEVLDAAFARALAGMVLPAEWMEYLKVELRKGQVEAQRFHQESIDRLETECARIQRRLDQMYVDKLDGLIDADTYGRNARQWQEDLRAQRRAMGKHDEAKQSYLEEGLVILSLAQETPALFEAATRDEKRELLSHLLSNSTWANGTLTVEWRKPFVFLAEFASPGDEEPPSEEALEGGVSNVAPPVGRSSNHFHRSGRKTAGRSQSESTRTSRRGRSSSQRSRNSLNPEDVLMWPPP
jgi:site-specific DNA recombinase